MAFQSPAARIYTAEQRGYNEERSPQPDWKHKSKLHTLRNTVWSSFKQLDFSPRWLYLGFPKSIRIGTMQLYFMIAGSTSFKMEQWNRKFDFVEHLFGSCNDKSCQSTVNSLHVEIYNSQTSRAHLFEWVK